MGNSMKTWSAADAAPWPQTLLPSRVPNARILTYGYDAHVADWRAVVSNNRIGNHAWNLLTAVAAYRENDDSVSLCVFAHRPRLNTDIDRLTST